ncbi:MAG: hypothetical protein GC165_14610 [Armatimonadetes bacterium]|nr:hypothetical protein [Armatimonadota bacterium]
MDVPADTRVNTLSKQRMVLIALLVVSVLGNAVWIVKSRNAVPAAPIATVKKEDIEVRGTVGYLRGRYEVEGTITNTSKVDATKVELTGVFTVFQPLNGNEPIKGEHPDLIDTFRNLKAGETRTFHAFLSATIDKRLIIGKVEEMRGDGVAYVYEGANPKLDWKVSTEAVR